MTESNSRVSDIDRHVSAEIRKHRMLAGMSQANIARTLGITFQQVQKYETGANRISAGRLFELAHLFGIPVSAFYAGLAPLPGQTESSKAREAHALLTLVETPDVIELLRAVSHVSPRVRRALVCLARCLASSSETSA